MSWYYLIFEQFSSSWYNLAKVTLSANLEKVTDQRQLLIADMINTPECRTALAQAMVDPIRQALNYQSLGRKLLMVDELPQGAFARYESDVVAGMNPQLST